MGFNFYHLKNTEEVVIMGHYGNYAGYDPCAPAVAPVGAGVGGFTLIVVLFILLIIVGAGGFVGAAGTPVV